MYSVVLVASTFLLVIVPTMVHAVAITDYTVSPDVGEEGYSSSVSEFAFFRCKITSDYNNNTMAVGWLFNGQIFADASKINGNLNIRPNVNEIFGFDTGTNLETSFALTTTPTGADPDNIESYMAGLDLLVGNWRYNGDYQCSICVRKSDGRCDDNEPSIVESEPFRLNVKYFPPEEYPQIESTPPTLGAETTISCITYPGYPLVSVTLMKSGNDVSGELFAPENPGDLLFYNYTYIMTEDDENVIFSCTIANAFTDKGETTPTNYARSVQLDPLEFVSVPEVTISGPKSVKYNSSLVLTCEATSPTSHEIIEIRWSSDPVLPEDRYNSKDETLTIESIQEEDDDRVISCHVTDSKEMTGSGSYTIDAVPTSGPGGDGPPVAIIVVVCIVGIILILLLLFALYHCCKKRKQSKPGYKYNHSSNVSTTKNHYPDHKSMNGPYTISSSVASQQNSAQLPPYNARDYGVDGDYNSRTAPPRDDIDGLEKYPEYERQRSGDQFYPGDERSPDYHYNTGYDEGRGDYPVGYDDMQVGDFTQPTDRQPAYGQGYDDDYNDQRGPVGYDDYDYKAPPAGYDDREPYGEKVPYDDRGPYEDRGPYDDRDPYEERGPYDDGGPYDDRFAGRYDEDPYRSPRDDGYNNSYYPPEENYRPGEPYPDQGGYDDRNLPYEDAGYPRDQDMYQNGNPDYSREQDMYPSGDPNYPSEYGPYGERDQVPDGQEADYQGDPYSESYNPPIIDDRLPDGGINREDPFYDLYNMKQDGGMDDFDDPQKYPVDAQSQERFDPSYV